MTWEMFHGMGLGTLFYRTCSVHLTCWKLSLSQFPLFEKIDTFNSDMEELDEEGDYKAGLHSLLLIKYLWTCLSKDGMSITFCKHTLNITQWRQGLVKLADKIDAELTMLSWGQQELLSIPERHLILKSSLKASMQAKPNHILSSGSPDGLKQQTRSGRRLSIFVWFYYSHWIPVKFWCKYWNDTILQQEWNFGWLTESAGLAGIQQE